MTIEDMIKELRAIAEHYDKEVSKRMPYVIGDGKPASQDVGYINFCKGKADGLRLAADKLVTLL